jgi:hypothetical protein
MAALKMTLVASIVVMLNVIKLSVIKQTEPPSKGKNKDIKKLYFIYSKQKLLLS